MSNPAEQPSFGGYPPHGEHPPAQPGYPPAPGQPAYPPPPGYQVQQYPPQYGQPQGQPYPPPQQYQQPYPQPYPPQYPPQPAPQVVIQNNMSATAIGGGYGLRKRQSAGVHILLFLFTAGLGNVLYAWYVIDWNRRRGL